MDYLIKVDWITDDLFKNSGSYFDKDPVDLFIGLFLVYALNYKWLLKNI
jgi:hypothetical protein